jgi:hypothetical protein
MFTKRILLRNSLILRAVMTLRRIQMKSTKLRVLILALAASAALACGGPAASMRQPVEDPSPVPLTVDGAPVVCGREMQLGKLISRKVCRRVADVDEERDAVRRLLGTPMNRPGGSFDGR